MTLEESHRLSVYNTVYSVLQAIESPVESSQLEELVRSVLASAHEACADFSERWNHGVSKGTAQRLPPEVLSECLRACDFTTRVRASHVSRRWRTIALDDRRLWTRFSRASFRDLHDQETAFDQLEEMLRRSAPLPFFIQLPHSYYGGFGDYEAPLPCILRHGIQRVHEYSGPYWAFSESSFHTRSYPNLFSFDCLDPTWTSDDFEVRTYWGAGVMPNLRCLSGPSLQFSERCHPLSSLTSLTCYLSTDPGDYQHLFRCCPSLVSLDIGAIFETTPLPPGPFPATLQDVTLRGSDEDDDTRINYRTPLMAWPKCRIPRLTIHGASSLSAPVSLFLASTDGPVALSIGGPGESRVTISTGEHRWQVNPWPFRLQKEWFDDMRTLLAGRVSSITVAIDYIDDLLAACIHAPLLTSLELTLVGEIGWSLPRAPADYRLEVPKLRHVVLDIPESSDTDDIWDYSSEAISCLTHHFRSVLVYDADLLDTITLRNADHDAVQSGLATFAREYIVTSLGALTGR
ncbi:hypothetical protein AURDEDRAFT_162615 [Auricularia subglabra TFB-10046 SS5]|nr:hypothetical protein AURDEDRAFT_162615 [Auricularia subglabra TFB-10046 SS5]